jgi:hypothetical protein
LQTASRRTWKTVRVTIETEWLEDEDAEYKLDNNTSDGDEGGSESSDDND